MRSEPVSRLTSDRAVDPVPGGRPDVRDGAPADAAACAGIYSDWVEATGWMPKVHARDDLERFYRERLFATCRVLVAEEAGAVRGFLALDGEGMVAALFVAGPDRGRGIGATLARAAQALRPEGLTLWCFVANGAARRFYARLGFVEAGGTEGENDEGLPDVMLTWRGFA